MERPSLSEVITLVGDLGRGVWELLDNCETSGEVGAEVHTIDGRDLANVSALLDRIEALPFEDPGYILGAGAMLETALQQLTGTPLSQAALDAIAERNRQQTVEGWTPAHDDQYHQNELVIAAIGYAAATEFRRRNQASVMSRIHGGVSTGWFRWPFNWSWWKPKDHRRDLIKAIALLLAEVERFDREIARSRPGELP